MNITKRKALLFFLLTFASFLTVIVICNLVVHLSARHKLYYDVKDIPFNRVGILLGVYKFHTDGSVNPDYEYRIQAAAELIKAGKINYLIASGRDNTKGYNEPVMMRDDLHKQGVDTSIIYLDYSGFRTYDSMVRLKEVFGQDSVTVISQKYHNERALFIARKEEIAAVGYNAKQGGSNINMREKFARVKVFIDYLTNKQPRHLEGKVAIPKYSIRKRNKSS